MSILEEGSQCPDCWEGIMELPPVENCSCHINPPCEACVNNKLECSGCGWSDDVS